MAGTDEWRDVYYEFSASNSNDRNERVNHDTTAVAEANCKRERSSGDGRQILLDEIGATGTSTSSSSSVPRKSMKTTTQRSNDVTWTEFDEEDAEREKAAKMCLESEETLAPADQRERCLEEAATFWDAFHSHHDNKFFKARRYLHLEYPELIGGDRSVETAPSRPYPHKGKNVVIGVAETPKGDSSHQIPANGKDEIGNTKKEAEGTEESASLTGLEREKGEESHMEKNAPLRVMEVGCGSGSTVFPLMELNPNMKMFAFDFSPKAVETVKTNPAYDEERCIAFVCDISRDEVPSSIVECASLDFVTLIFALSAIPPARMVESLRRLYCALKPGGSVLFRDYGLHDMTQLRFVRKGKRKLMENTYARGDGTTVYFFSLDETERLFREAGFVTTRLLYDRRELRNRKTKVCMYRVWVKGKFTRPLSPT